jgi:hypothetical protein
MLDYSLDEAFALSLDNFKAGDFSHPGSSSDEMVIIERLHNLLKERELI